MDIEKIGKFIKELRSEKKLTQKELADKLSITVQAVSKWERRKGLPDISYLEDLSKIFEVSILEILKGERTDKIEDNDILYSVKYGKDTTKEKILRIINNTMKIIVVTLAIFIISGNALNIYFAEKDYNNYYLDEILENKIDENLKLINLIKNNQGIYTDEEYETIMLTNFDGIEEYLKGIKELTKKDKLKYTDYLNQGESPIYTAQVLDKYKNFNYEEIMKIFVSSYMGKFEYFDFLERFGKNFYLYQIDLDYENYLNAKNVSDVFIINSMNELLKSIVEAGEIHE